LPRPDQPPAAALAGNQAEGGPGEGQPGGGRRGRFNPEEMLKQFDKNGDGQLDEEEREAGRAAMAERFRGMGGPGGTGMPGFNREEMLKRFDTNGDGELDETERTAMRDALRAERGGQRNRPDRQNGGPGAGLDDRTGAAPGEGRPGRTRPEGDRRPPSE